MNKLFTFILFLLFTRSAGAQNWAPVSGDRFNFQLEKVLYDSIHDKLLASSKFMKTIGSFPVRGIASWDGTVWDSLSNGINTHDTLNTTPFGMALSCITYNGKLLVGGMFGSVGGVNATSLATWDGVSWDSLPVRAFRFSETPPQVAGFYQYGSLLYIYGNFDSIAGQPASGLATWDGTSFQPIMLPASDVGGIKGIIEFQNELYVCGSFYNPGIFNGLRHILRFDGSNWVSVGGGLLGLNSGLSSMLIYKDELYVGGHFLISEGNVGENIMKWDGAQWHDVGFGGELTGVVWQMLVFKDKLWAVGNFSTAAYMPATFIASYDGEQWCIPKDTLINGLISLTVYHDTLYTAGAFTAVYGDTNFSYIAKLRDPNLYRECSSALPTNNQATTLLVYPNPFNSQIIISSPTPYQNANVTIVNTFGQTVYSSVMNIASFTSIYPANLSRGVYYLKIQNGNEAVFSQKLIKITF